MLFYLLFFYLFNIVFTLNIKTKTIANSDNLKIKVRYSNPTYYDYDSYPLLFVHGSNSGSWVFEEKWFEYFNYLGIKSYGINLRGSKETGNINNDTLKIKDLESDLRLVLNNFDNICDINEEYELNKKPVIVAHSFGGIILTKLFEKNDISDLISGAIWLSPYPHGNSNFIARFLFSDKIINIFKDLYDGKIRNEDELNRYLFYDDEMDIDLIKKYTNRSKEDSKYKIDSLDLFFNMPYEEDIVYNSIPKLIISSYNDLLIDMVSINDTARILNINNIEMINGSGHNIMLGTYNTLGAEKIVNFLDKKL